LLYLRVAATAAVLLLLGGCSFFGFWDAPDTPAQGSKIDSQASGGPLAGTQLAALPGYQSDQAMAPSRVEAIPGYIGSPSVRPTRPTAAVQGRSVQVRPIKRDLTFKDLLPRRQVLDLQPIAAAFQPRSHSLADLIADRDWRKRTSETLNRLFQ
jgi:hypothetical protein